ncbi:MAG: phage tail protein [Patescibacteria group bacterium]|nr:phage tail protein [Patescibacteria group bacterium]
MTDEVSIGLSGGGAQTLVTGWQRVRVTVGIERVPPDFEVTYTERIADGTTSIAAAGQACTVKIGSDVVITGYVDRVMERLSAGMHEVTLAGRGKTQDLVDCAAVWQGAMFRNVTAQDVATKLCAPYGITVATSESDLKRLPVIMVNIGETAYELIDRVSKLSGILAFEDFSGRLVLSRVGTVQASSGFEEGRNVQRASYERSMDQRFSNYTVVYPGNQLLGDEGVTPLTTFSYPDPGVPRLRQKYIELLTNDAGEAFAQAQARWEMNRRVGRSAVVCVTTDAWRDSGGTLWTPNTLATVEAPSVKVSRTQLLIAEVSFMRDLDEGTTAELVLMPPQAFDVEPILYVPIPGDIEAAMGLGP